MRHLVRNGEMLDAELLPHLPIMAVDRGEHSHEDGNHDHHQEGPIDELCPPDDREDDRRGYRPRPVDEDTALPARLPKAEMPSDHTRLRQGE